MIDVLVSVVSEKDNMCLSYRWLDGSGYFFAVNFCRKLMPEEYLTCHIKII